MQDSQHDEKSLNWSAREACGAIRTVVADDHPLVRSGIVAALLFEGGFEVAAEVSREEEVKRAVTDHRPDLLILDLVLHFSDGVELIKHIRCLSPDTRILVISAHDERTHAERALRAGAHGYISKHENPELLIIAAQAVAKGEGWISRKMAALLPGQGVTGYPRLSTKSLPLSDREAHVFRLIGARLRSGEIAREMGVSPKTVQAHRENIKVKLQLRDGAELLEKAVQWLKRGEL